eukprot:1148315-Pelagomonas_calceolata.AAC.3
MNAFMVPAVPLCKEGGKCWARRQRHGVGQTAMQAFCKRMGCLRVNAFMIPAVPLCKAGGEMLENALC